MDTDLHWTCQPFHQLGVEQLYAILALRDQVFVLEQQSLYGDVDGLDIDSHHVCAWHPTAGLVAYARLLPPDLKYPHCAAIGRVVIAPAWRHLGLGKKLFAYALTETVSLWPRQDIMLSAQHDKCGLYAQFGFVAQGELFDDGGVLHQTMLRKSV